MIPGVVIAGPAALAEACGNWTASEMLECFSELERQGMAKADWSAHLVWLPGAVAQGDLHKPESPNVVRAWGKRWLEVPKCPLKSEAFQALKAFVEGFGEAFGEAFGHPSSNQEQEQEYDLNARSGENAASVPPSGPGRSGEGETRGAGSSTEVSPPTEASAATEPRGTLQLLPPTTPERPVLEFPCRPVGTRGGRAPDRWPLTRERLAEFEQRFPELDVLLHCRKALEWCHSRDAGKRKTYGGMPKFLGTWLANELERQAQRGTGPPKRDTRPALPQL